MRVLVWMNGDYSDNDRVYHVLDSLRAEHEMSILVHRGASPGEAIAGEWAASRGIQQVICSSAQGDESAVIDLLLDILLRDKEHAIVIFPGSSGSTALIERAEASDVRLIHVGNDFVCRPGPSDCARRVTLGARATTLFTRLNASLSSVVQSSGQFLAIWRPRQNGGSEQEHRAGSLISPAAYHSNPGSS